MENCHGCKWLDETKKGCGYCAMVSRSTTYKAGDKVRSPEKARCELFAAGDFKTRFKEVRR